MPSASTTSPPRARRVLLLVAAVGAAVLADGLPAAAMPSPETPSPSTPAPTAATAPTSTPSPAPTAPTPAPPTSAQVAALGALIRARTQPGSLGRSLGVAVVDVPSGALLYSRAGTVGMRPASTMKVLTATSALTVYGPDHRWATRVTRATYGNAVHLTLVGGGDPLLTDADLAALAAQVRRRSGRGAVVVNVDDTALGARGPAPGWTSRYIGEEVTTVSALGRLGDTSPDAATAAGRAFTAALVRAGVAARWAGRAADRAGRSVTVAAYPGHTLTAAVRVMLLTSNNNIAETLFRHLGVDVARDGTWAGSRRAQEQTLRSLGVDLSGSALVDGSGLSRSDRVSASLLAHALRLAADGAHPRLAVMLASALPVAGRTGTLVHRYHSGHAVCAAGRVRAKTGSLYDTITLAGVAATTQRRAYAFAILVGRPTPGANTRAAIDGMVSAVVGC